MGISRYNGASGAGQPLSRFVPHYVDRLSEAVTVLAVTVLGYLGCYLSRAKIGAVTAPPPSTSPSEIHTGYSSPWPVIRVINSHVSTVIYQQNVNETVKHWADMFVYLASKLVTVP